MLFILFKFIDYFLIKIMFHARKCSKQAACSKKLAVHKLFLQVFCKQQLLACTGHSLAFLA